MNRYKSKIGVCVLSAMVISALLIIGMVPVSAEDKTESQGIVDKANVTLGAFLHDMNYTWLHENIKNAKGILIYPQVLKAGYIFGGSGGTGVLLVKENNKGEWSQPVFYTVGAISFGLQIGGEVAETVILAMTQKAVDSLFTSSVKLGGDASVALGPVGAGAQSDVTTDFIAFSKSKGIYGGISLDGSVVGVRDSLNKAYYGKEVSPVQIIVEKKVSNKGSAKLRATLAKAGK